MAIFRRYGWASSAAEITGKSTKALEASRRCARAAAQSRAASRRSKARPSRSSNSGSGGRSGTRDLLLELLDAPEPCVDAARPEQLVVPPGLHDPAFDQDDDAVGELGRP